MANLKKMRTNQSTKTGTAADRQRGRQPRIETGRHRKQADTQPGRTGKQLDRKTGRQEGHKDRPKCRRVNMHTRRQADRQINRMADCMERMEKEGLLLYFKKETIFISKMVVSVSSCREVKYKVFCSQSPKGILNFFPVLSRSNIKNSSDDSANYAKKWNN
jgi:hypothetical protein